jgi:hypothetical protein
LYRGQEKLLAKINNKVKNNNAMLFSIPYLEWIGYIASIIIAISLTMSSIIKLRWYNLVGAAIFSFYGFAIGALPVGLLNLFIVLANVFYLAKISAQKEVFKSIKTAKGEAYLNYFLDFYGKEIARFFPDFADRYKEIELENKQLFAFFVLRNATVAGVFIGVKNDKQVEILIDFVIPEYRDFKVGKYIYSDKNKLFTNESIDTIMCTNANPQHSDYLVKMGFHKGQNDVFVKR